MPLSKNSQIVQEYLDQFGLELKVRELEESTRTAQDAANAVNCQLGQIVKSLIFRSGDRPLLFLVSGKNQLNVHVVSAQLDITLEKANADFVRTNTGFPIGGVPPVAHAQKMDVFIDRDLITYDLVWAAAGTPHAVFPLKSKDLPRITNGRLIDVQ
jgi:prolyl-tRNA editing enzyme YbaK/EbsC (Cys-tRNA(Pro) deacylase)